MGDDPLEFDAQNHGQQMGYFWDENPNYHGDVNRYRPISRPNSYNPMRGVDVTWHDEVSMLAAQLSFFMEQRAAERNKANGTFVIDWESEEVMVPTHVKLYGTKNGKMVVVDVVNELITLDRAIAEGLVGAQNGGLVDLSNPNDKELYSQINDAYYRALRGGKTLTNADLFDFSNVEYSEYHQWERTLNFKSEGEEVTVRVVIMHPLANPESDHDIKRYALYNAKGHRNPSSWPGTYKDKPVRYPFRLQMENYVSETQAQFFFHRSSGAQFSYFQSYLNTGKSKYLPK